jgi:hypothetical protein
MVFIFSVFHGHEKEWREAYNWTLQAFEREWAEAYDISFRAFQVGVGTGGVIGDQGWRLQLP